jgi:hypothetical protein
MEYEAGDYQKLQIKQYPARTQRETAEGKYWKQFKAPVVAKQVGAAVPVAAAAAGVGVDGCHPVVPCSLAASPT